VYDDIQEDAMKKRLNQVRAVARRKRLTTVGLCGPVLLGAFTAAAEFAIDWHTVDGGGGFSTGTVYSVSGTVGQPDARAASGGAYALQGGFWSVVTVLQTPNAPQLAIAVRNGIVYVSWPLPADGWVLGFTNALPHEAAAPWPRHSPPYASAGGRMEFAEPVVYGAHFYRLFKDP
jgi:hypothetical protein